MVQVWHWKKLCNGGVRIEPLVGSSIEILLTEEAALLTRCNCSVTQTSASHFLATESSLEMLQLFLHPTGLLVSYFHNSEDLLGCNYCPVSSCVASVWLSVSCSSKNPGWCLPKAMLQCPHTTRQVPGTWVAWSQTEFTSGLEKHPRTLTSIGSKKLYACFTKET